eukprot:NODE_7145_length_585_cov_16.479478_g6145_i0.p3 GENE.NODE_7145_length_585_cov_16.479478_g6145_i0~~NODE_7145_length_585_cov_16.479478_g6145_i0.p3  ORF type:complete len:76 (+),score=2.52 NODE_7145_length_585_cov_16.479478_g6145_i0:108-335(+)
MRQISWLPPGPARASSSEAAGPGLARAQRALAPGGSQLIRPMHTQAPGRARKARPGPDLARKARSDTIPAPKGAG